MQEMLEREEVEVRGDPADAVGPPWRDECTGEVLSTEEVEKAMEDKRNSLKSFKMARPATEEERNVPGTDY
eukprot:12345774-Heterocapsa_arctica.AAC.1